jgi:hypothetical protein
VRSLSPTSERFAKGAPLSVRFADPEDMLEGRRPIWLRRALISFRPAAVWAAGRAAEKLFRRQLPVLASADDLENAFHLLASTGIRETPDVNAVLDGGRARARELLREHETTDFDE